MKYKIEVWFNNGMCWSRIVDTYDMSTDKISFKSEGVGGVIFLEDAVGWCFTQIPDEYEPSMEFNN